jgi:hypothetical protein
MNLGSEWDLAIRVCWLLPEKLTGSFGAKNSSILFDAAPAMSHKLIQSNVSFLPQALAFALYELFAMKISDSVRPCGAWH